MLWGSERRVIRTRPRQLGRALLCEKLDPWDLEDYGCQPELEQLRQLMDTLET